MKYVAMAIGLAALPVLAQSGPVFEAASVKLSEKTPPRGDYTPVQGGPGTGDPGRFTARRVPLQTLIMLAFDRKSDEVVGLGRATDRYDVTATMAPTTTQAEFRAMLQGLLRERFELAAHEEKRMVPGYDLIVAAGGAKLKEWNAEKPLPDDATSRRSDR